MDPDAINHNKIKEKEADEKKKKEEEEAKKKKAEGAASGSVDATMGEGATSGSVPIGRYGVQMFMVRGCDDKEEDWLKEHLKFNWTDAAFEDEALASSPYSHRV